MAWVRMRFKGQAVWVRADGRGRPVLDGAGRAEMKYREGDTRVYRPGASNLEPAGEEEATVLPDEEAAAPAAPGRGGHAPKEGGAPSDRIDVWTDGACSGNPGPMGIGVVVLVKGRRREHGEYLGIGTNNIAELVAIERGLDLAVKEGGDRSHPIHVHTDSGYSIGVLSKGWKAKANQELIARVRGVLGELPHVRLVKVPGHAGVPENERCDELAREAIARRGKG